MNITVFTPTYNRAHTLERLFNSFQSQTLQDFDWLIIDDGSVDNTREVVENFKDAASFEIKYFYKENGGKYTAMAEAKKHLKNKYVVIIDSDDELLPHTLEVFETHMNSNPALKEIRGRCLDQNMNLIEKFKFPLNKNFIDSTYHEMVLKNKNDEELLSCFTLDYYLEAVQLPKDIIFKNKFKNFGEAYFWARIKNVPIRFINEPVRIYHTDSGNSITKNTANKTGFYDDIVGNKYYLDSNHQYFFWPPKYFLSLYLKVSIASKIVGYSFIKSHFLYDSSINRLISILLYPISFIMYQKMKHIDKKYWR